VGRHVCGGGGGCHILSQFAVHCALHDRIVSRSRLTLPVLFAHAFCRFAEQEALECIARHAGMPPSANGTFVSGGACSKQGTPASSCCPAHFRCPEVSCALCTDRLWSRHRGQPQRIDRGGACMTAKRSPHCPGIHFVGSSCVLVSRMQRWWWRHRASPKGSRDRIRGAILCSAFAHSSVESAAHAMDVVRAPIHAAADASLWVNPVSVSHQRKGQCTR
jgi:hypothetical protein